MLRTVGRDLPRSFFEALLIAVLLAIFVRTFVLQGVFIPTPSMSPSLLVGDHVVVNRIIFNLPLSGFGAFLPSRAIRRWDVLVFRFPGDPATLLVKRCIGLPGERVEIVDNRVLINGTTLDESSYLATPSHSSNETAAAQMPALVLPRDRFFLLGDDRSQSLDSRDLGSIPRASIQGKLFLIYWSNSAVADATGGRLLGAAADFFSRTRWRRTFHIVR